MSIAQDTDTSSPSSTTKNPVKPTKKERKLTPKQKRFAEAYTNIADKRTFGNATQSALEAYNTTKPEIAHTIAQETIRKPSVLNYIEELNAQHGNSIEERSKILALCMQGKLYSESTIQQVDDTGTVKSETRVSKGISPAQILKAIDLSNKVEGIYNRTAIAEHVAKREYDIKMQELRESLQKRVQAVKRSSTRLEPVECSGEAV